MYVLRDMSGYISTGFNSNSYLIKS